MCQGNPDHCPRCLNSIDECVCYTADDPWLVCLDSTKAYHRLVESADMWASRDEEAKREACLERANEIFGLIKSREVREYFLKQTGQGGN